ncbi:MAG: glutathione binding-like protein [Burkholderiaceae bacterium]
MIDLYTRPDPEGQKVQIMLEECGLAYAIHLLNPSPDHELPARYLSICADQKAPAIVDHDSIDGRPLAVSQSLAILIYLSGKTGRFLPKADRDRFKMLEWLSWAASPGMRASSDTLNETVTPDDPLLAVLDTQLGRTRAFIAGRQYTAADISIIADCLAISSEPAAFAAFPNLQRWFEAVNSRPAVRRALATMNDGERRARATDHLELRLREVPLETR